MLSSYFANAPKVKHWTEGRRQRGLMQYRPYGRLIRCAGLFQRVKLHPFLLKTERPGLVGVMQPEDGVSCCGGHTGHQTALSSDYGAGVVG